MNVHNVCAVEKKTYKALIYQKLKLAALFWTQPQLIFDLIQSDVEGFIIVDDAIFLSQ